ncbi:MAG: Gx transporter family protein [Eubacterium sp.]
MNRSRIIAEYALYTALAFLFGYLENLFPLPLPFPGMKIGFANLIFILTLYKKGLGYTLSLSLLRIVLNAFTFGSLFGMIYSLAGSLLSIFFMDFLKWMAKDRLSMLSVSAAGGVAHCMGQWLVASFIVGFDSLRWYAPILYFSGLISGGFIGFLALQCANRRAL